MSEKQTVYSTDKIVAALDTFNHIHPQPKFEETKEDRLLKESIPQFSMLFRAKSKLKPMRLSFTFNL